MPDTTVNSVEEFDARYTKAGRLKRYAHGRVRSFLARQALTLTGSLFLIFLASPQVGLLACFAVLLGETVDCLTLTRVSYKLGRGMSLQKAYWITTLSGTFQAVTVTYAVTLSWFNTPHVGGTFFTLAYLTGAVINAGIVLPFHPAVTKARIGVYTLCVTGLFLHRAILEPPDPFSVILYDLLGMMMMSYMAYIFIAYMVRGFGRQRRNKRETLLRTEALANAYSELREKQIESRRLSLVARHAMDSVIMSDAAGRILWVNDTFTKVTGYTAQEAEGRTPGELLNGPDTSRAASEGIAIAIRAGQPHRTEILNYRKDGQKIWVETTLVPVLDDKDQVEMVVAIERDITQAREHAQQLAEAKIEAEEGARAKSRFLATMSHEIRTPMNGVIGMADLLCDADLPQEYLGYAKTIRNSAEALLSILNDILDLSKLEAGRVELNPVDFAPAACFEGVTRLLRPQAKTKDLTLELTFPHPPDLVWGDDTRLRQVLLNVIGNAIKFTENGGVFVDVEAQNSPTGYLLHIRIRDTGIGIPEDRLDHIFDPFAQADADTTRRFGGTGLGLSISRKLMEAMGGSISVSSAPGQGSCFCLEMPVEAARLLPKAGHKARAQDLTAGLKVLVAEDNNTNRLIIKKFFQNAPIDLHFAHDGEEAVQKTAEHKPDIIFMDMSMPVMDGLAATRTIRASNGPQPQIVALTANGFASDRRACVEAGMDGFLTKPVRKAELLQCLSALRPAL
ncbi:MAG: hybrid sensor histidine kinase/response regulator [Rhodobacteraceae bacterium]|nr:hybrid sensor histidine kinase/response regulator [Paracoccaceae bacterium]MBT26605.1 hybrid sensor histidine kinase/response regulator [Paracoccaceae bacterium]